MWNVKFAFILFHIIQISKGSEISQEFNNEYEEANLIIKLENWSSDSETVASFEFSLGAKLFGQDFVWELSATRYREIELTGISVSQISGPFVSDRVIRTKASVLSCLDGSFGPTSIFSPIVFEPMSQAVFKNEVIDKAPFVCPQDWIRFAVNFRIYKNETRMYTNLGILSNEVPLIVTNEILPNSSAIDKIYTIGSDIWGKSSSWHLYGPSYDPIDQYTGPYTVTLESTDFTSKTVFAAGWFQYVQEWTWRPITETTFVFLAEEYEVGQSVTLDLSQSVKFDNDSIIHVEFYWETFGENARFSDYIPFELSRKIGGNVKYIHPQKLIN